MKNLLPLRSFATIISLMLLSFLLMSYPVMAAGGQCADNKKPEYFQLTNGDFCYTGDQQTGIQYIRQADGDFVRKDMSTSTETNLERPVRATIVGLNNQRVTVQYNTAETFADLEERTNDGYDGRVSFSRAQAGDRPTSRDPLAFGDLLSEHTDINGKRVLTGVVGGRAVAAQITGAQQASERAAQIEIGMAHEAFRDGLDGSLKANSQTMFATNPAQYQNIFNKYGLSPTNGEQQVNSMLAEFGPRTVSQSPQSSSLSCSGDYCYYNGRYVTNEQYADIEDQFKQGAQSAPGHQTVDGGPVLIKGQKYVDSQGIELSAIVTEKKINGNVFKYQQNLKDRTYEKVTIDNVGFEGLDQADINVLERLAKNSHVVARGNSIGFLSSSNEGSGQEIDITYNPGNKQETKIVRAGEVITKEIKTPSTGTVTYRYAQNTKLAEVRSDTAKNYQVQYKSTDGKSISLDSQTDNLLSTQYGSKSAILEQFSSAGVTNLKLSDFDEVPGLSQARKISYDGGTFILNGNKQDTLITQIDDEGNVVEQFHYSATKGSTRTAYSKAILGANGQIQLQNGGEEITFSIDKDTGEETIDSILSKDSKGNNALITNTPSSIAYTTNNDNYELSKNPITSQQNQQLAGRYALKDDTDTIYYVEPSSFGGLFGYSVVDANGKEVSDTIKEGLPLEELFNAMEKVKEQTPKKKNADGSTQQAPSRPRTETERAVANALDVFNRAYDYTSIGSWSSLFLPEDMLSEWRSTVDNAFASAYLGTEYWSSAICSEYTDGTPDGMIFLDKPSGPTQLAAYITGSRTPEAINEKGEPVYIYRFEVSIQNGENDYDEFGLSEMSFNIALQGDQYANVFREKQRLEQGQSFKRTGSSSIVKESNVFYNYVCIQFDQVPYRWNTGSNELCNTITETSQDPLPISASVSDGGPTGSSSGTSSELSDF